MAGTTPIGGYPAPDNTDSVTDIGASVARSLAALEKAALNPFQTTAARNSAITSVNAVVGMYSVILSPSPHLERLMSISGTTLNWMASDVQLVASKAQQSALSPTPGAMIYRTDTNVLSLADVAGGKFWAIGRAGAPIKYEQSGKGSVTVDSVPASNSPNAFRMAKYDFTVTPTCDGYAKLSTVAFGGTSSGRSDGGSANGWQNAKIVHSRDGVLLSPFGSFADVVLTEGGVNYLGWSCPQDVYLQEGVATTFSVTAQINNPGVGSFLMADFRWVLFQ